MTRTLVFAGASVTGHQHSLLGRNNQDAYFVSPRTFGGCQLALVADGCGSSAYSELGARLGIRIAARCLRDSYVLNRHEHPPDFYGWDYLTASIVAELKMVLRLIAAGEATETVVKEHLLFTLLGVLADERQTTFFAAGDGLLIINGEPLVLEAKHNAPAYLGYLTFDEPPPLFIGLRPVASLPTTDMDSFVLATDGALGLLDSKGRSLPRQGAPVMDLSSFPHYDRFYQNPDALRRYLALINRETTDPDTGAVYKGNLADDTTVILGRTRQED